MFLNLFCMRQCMYPVCIVVMLNGWWVRGLHFSFPKNSFLAQKHFNLYKQEQNLHDEFTVSPYQRVVSCLRLNFKILVWCFNESAIG